MSATAEKILVVDDDEAGCYAKTRVIQRAGYAVTTAGTGQDALRQVASDSPALVLLDANLPDINGFEVCRRIKQDHAGVLVIQTSAAFTSAQDRAAGLAGGADSYLVEPMEPEELTATIAALLRTHATEHALREANATLEQQIVAETAHRAEAEMTLGHVQRLDVLGQLTGGIAHDFNNLLTVVLGNLEMLEKTVHKNGPLQPEILLRLINGSQRAAKECEYLTRQLLAFGRRDPVRVELFDAAKRLRDSESFLKRVVGERVVLRLDIADAPCGVRLDPMQLEATILNLAVNARDAMPEGGMLTISARQMEVGSVLDPRFTAMSWLPARPVPGNYIEIAVTDTGSGMAPDVLEHAFEPFFTTKDVGKGSGLGLPQVFGFVKQSEGTVAVRSVSGRGTEFHLLLPSAERRSAARPTIPESSGDAPRGSETILVVEDNDLVRETVIGMMEELGYHILHADDGPAAMTIINGETPIDLLFTDVVMPKQMSGLELAKAAQQRRPQLKVLVTSGYAASVAPDGTGFPSIGKPYRRLDLARKLRQVLA